MFLVAQKWRGSIVIMTMRIMQTEQEVRDYFTYLKDPKHSTPGNPGRWGSTSNSGMIYDTGYWFVWEASVDAEPVLCKDLLKEIR